MTFKPLLAVNADLDKLKFPLYLSAKYDGIRVIIRNGAPVSRTLKPIPNKYIRETIEKYGDILEGFDGELIVGSPTASDCFSRTTSAVMSYDGEPDFAFYVFDKVGEGGYEDRWFRQILGDARDFPTFVTLVEQQRCFSLEQVGLLEQEHTAEGYEGVMLRSPDGKYKTGRSTVNEGILLKLKRFEDFEAEIIGFEERLHNANEATTDLLGHTERSSHKDNMIPMNTLGSLIVKSDLFPTPFNVGTGFDDETRQHIWDNRESFLGQLAKIKHQPSGALNLPRFPVFLGVRSLDDM